VLPRLLSKTKPPGVELSHSHKIENVEKPRHCLQNARQGKQHDPASQNQIRAKMNRLPDLQTPAKAQDQSRQQTQQGGCQQNPRQGGGSQPRSQRGQQFEVAIAHTRTPGQQQEHMIQQPQQAVTQCCANHGQRQAAEGVIQVDQQTQPQQG